MANISEYRRIYKLILDSLVPSRLSRRELISTVIDAFELSESERTDDSLNGKLNILRTKIGSVISEMETKGILKRDDSSLYFALEKREVAIRIEECEREILDSLKSSPKTKYQLKDSLVSFFGTDTTSTIRDDNKLFTYMGQILKRLVGEDVIAFDGSVYSILEEKSAYIENRREMLMLKAAFLTKLHSKGGEFFEHYFLKINVYYS